MTRAHPSSVASALAALAAAALGLGCGGDEPEPPAPLPQVHELATKAPAPGAFRAKAPRIPIDDELLGAIREPDPFDRACRMANVLATYDADDVDQVLAALLSPALDLGAVETALLVERWAAHQPEAASRWAFQRSPSAFRSAAILSALEQWGRADPQAALAFTQPMGAIQGAPLPIAQIGLIRGWFDSGLPGLEEYIRDLGVGFDRQRALGVLARRAIQRYGPDTIMKWARSLPDEPMKFKLEAYRQVSSELAQADPAAAVRWCDEICEGPFGSSSRPLIAQRWANQDGAAALAWVSTAPPGPERDAAVRDAMRGWWRMDRDALIAWMRDIGFDGVEPWLQNGLEPFAIWTAQIAPEESLQWAARIEDPAARERTYIEVNRKWRLEDEAAAEAWLVQSPLDDEARELARVPATKKAQLEKEAREQPSADDPGEASPES